MTSLTVLRGLLTIGFAATLLSLPSGPAASAPAREGYADWGHTDARDQRLREGCHGYRYRWQVKPPTDDWNLETVLRSPDGRKLAADLFHSQEDGNRGKARFKVCGPATEPGRHVIRAKVIWRDGFDEHVSKLRPTRFALTRG